MFELSNWILTLMIAVPIIGAIAIAIARADSPEDEHKRLPLRALIFSAAELGLAIVAIVLFFQAKDSLGQSAAQQGEYALVQNLSWIDDASEGRIDFRYHVGVDGLSLWLLVLAAFITPLSIWASFTGIR